MGLDSMGDGNDIGFDFYLDVFFFYTLVECLLCVGFFFGVSQEFEEEGISLVVR